MDNDEKDIIDAMRDGPGRGEGLSVVDHHAADRRRKRAAVYLGIGVLCILASAWWLFG